MVKVAFVKKEVKLLRNVSNKFYLQLIKYALHTIAFLYIIDTLLQFFNVKLQIFGSFVHISLIPWILMYLTSIKFKFCYIHRLPLYYIFINELLINIDYYLGIPTCVSNLLIVHLFLIFILIMGYTLYYIKNIL